MSMIFLWTFFKFSNMSRQHLTRAIRALTHISPKVNRNYHFALCNDAHLQQRQHYILTVQHHC